MYKHGVLAMKAYPFHIGHEHLIQTALRQCEKVSVMVIWGEGQDIDGETRVQWVKQTFPQVTVYSVADIFVDDNNPEDSKLWAAYTKVVIEDDFDVVFSSEPYGQWWADLMGVKSVSVDPHRTYLPVSGTAIRNDPYLHWQYINRFARLHYLKRVLVVGAESTGKTTLCRNLAQRYSTRYVPEYGRIYAEKWDKIEDMPSEHRRVIFGDIVTKQPMLEKEIEQEARMVCFYDTDLFTTALFYEQWQPDRIGDRLHKTILQAAAKENKYDLVLIMDSDVPFIDDGQREQTEEQRQEVQYRLQQFYVEEFYGGQRVQALRGSFEERESVAIKTINQHCFYNTQATLVRGQQAQPR